MIEEEKEISMSALEHSFNKSLVDLSPIDYKTSNSSLQNISCLWNAFEIDNMHLITKYGLLKNESSFIVKFKEDEEENNYEFTYRFVF